MKKIFLIPLLLLVFIVSSGQSEQHFKTQKRLICKYKWTHNEKYFQQFVENWKNEVPEIPDSVVANWSPVSQNSYQVFQAIFDTTRYIDPEILNDYYIKNDFFSYFLDSSLIMIPNEMNCNIMEIKMNDFHYDSLSIYLEKEISNNLKLTFFKPHVNNQISLYLTEGYKKILLKNRRIFKKLNFYDYSYLRKKAAETKINKKVFKKIKRKHGNRNFFIKENQFNGSILANVEITFDKTFTYAFLENQNDHFIFVCQKKENKWYVIYLLNDGSTKKTTIIFSNNYIFL